MPGGKCDLSAPPPCNKPSIGGKKRRPPGADAPAGDGLLSTGIGDHIEADVASRIVADLSDEDGVARPAAANCSTNRRCKALAPPGVRGGERQSSPAAARAPRPSSGLGSKQNSRALSTSSACISIAQIICGGLIHG